jgi:hypothetical protein
VLRFAPDAGGADVVGVHQPDGVLVRKLIVALLAADDDALQRVARDDGHLPGVMDDDGVVFLRGGRQRQGSQRHDSHEFLHILVVV